MSSTHKHPGDVLAGRYRVERVVGRGAMGVVVAAIDERSGERVAIKYLSEAARQNAVAVERFLREARATIGLRSEHAVRVHDVGTLDDGTPYMAMEFLEGGDLGEELRRRGAIPTHEAAGYVMQVCEALAEAHARGVVHRDVKPANLFLTRGRDPSPIVKVLDFGLSKDLTPPEGDHELTRTNAVIGSPSYMAPEQLLSARDVDPRADIWSLGVILYQLITGRLPFQSQDVTEFVTRLLREPPAPPSKVRAGLPLAFDAVVMRCLEKDRARRYASVIELAEALHPFVPGALGLARPPIEAADEGVDPPRSRREPAHVLRDPLVIGIVSGALVVTLGIGVVLVARRSSPSGTAASTMITATAPASVSAPATASASVSATASASAPAPAPASASARAIPRKPGRPARPTGPSSDVVDPFGPRK